MAHKNILVELVRVRKSKVNSAFCTTGAKHRPEGRGNESVNSLNARATSAYWFGRTCSLAASNRFGSSLDRENWVKNRLGNKCKDTICLGTKRTRKPQLRVKINKNEAIDCLLIFILII